MFQGLGLSYMYFSSLSVLEHERLDLALDFMNAVDNNGND